MKQSDSHVQPVRLGVIGQTIFHQSPASPIWQGSTGQREKYCNDGRLWVRQFMGRCQGRNGLPTLVDFMAWHTGIPPDEVELRRARPVRIEDLLQEPLPTVGPIDHAIVHLSRGAKVSWHGREGAAFAISLIVCVGA
jgi:hypothetical protein